jgi:Mce-associated membrane protein
MPPRPRSPRPRPTPSRRPRVAGLAPIAPRPSGRIEDRPVDLAESATVVPASAPDAPQSDRSAPARNGSAGTDPSRENGRRPGHPSAGPDGDGAGRDRPTPGPARRPKPGPASAREAEPSTVTEAIPVLPALDLDAGGADPTEPAPSGDAPVAGGERQAAPAGKARRKPAAAPRPAAREGGAADDTRAESAAPARAIRLPAGLRHGAVPLLAAALVMLAAVAVVASIQDARLRGSPAAANTALVDVGATAEVAGQLSDAVETIYSFDFARLDENENAARDVITPEFAAEFDRLFGEVRARAPQQQAVVSATVTLSAVKEITGDRAVLVAFVDQQATRAAPDAQAQQLAAAGRLTVTGERVDGRWKIAAVTPL